MSNRACRKCGDIIPYRVTIEGKSKNIQNRKFCLKCSPYGMHNTSATNPLTRKERAKKKTYPSWTKEARVNHVKGLTERARGLKAKLIGLFGGGCELCNYSRCQAALTFHHIDPSLKSFELGSTSIRRLSWEKVLDEAAKCSLLCSRCHIEVHAGIVTLIPREKLIGISSTPNQRANSGVGTHLAQ